MCSYLLPFTPHCMMYESLFWHWKPRQDVSLSDSYMLSRRSLLLCSLTHVRLRVMVRLMSAHLNKQAEENIALNFEKCLTVHITPVQMQTNMTSMDRKTRCTITSWGGAGSVQKSFYYSISPLLLTATWLWTSSRVPLF